MFSKILIANRGEIAVRVIRTCRRLGIATVVVYSEADADSLAVSLADESLFIGPSPANQSYLVAEKIIAAAHETGAQAIHPGFGFLSEKAEFARQCAEAGIVFIGPNPEAIDAMGDKIQSKRFAGQAGVSVVPGHVGEIDDTAHAIRISEEIGYPVMIKASAGGGGKGIRVAWSRRDVEEGFPAVRAMSCTSLSGNAPSRGATRRSSRRRPRPSWTKPPASPWGPRPWPWPRPSLTIPPARWSSSPARISPSISSR